ncbi:hypothetical protein WN943_020597 [Citrus x changshan-huyou]
MPSVRGRSALYVEVILTLVDTLNQRNLSESPIRLKPAAPFVFEPPFVYHCIIDEVKSCILISDAWLDYSGFLSSYGIEVDGICLNKEFQNFMLIGVPLLKRQVKTLERLCKFFQAQNLLKKRLILLYSPSLHYGTI